MLRGAIDYITSSRIGGWLYSDAVTLKGRRVLAFLDGACVGTGLVDKFRQDLLDAGLGDGYLGFNFPITLSDPVENDRVVVRLDESDAIILQSGNCIARSNNAVLEAASEALPTQRPSAIKWMRGRGWLEQSEYDFLSLMEKVGVYDRILIAPKTNGQRQAQDPVVLARELIELYFMDEVEIKRATLSSISELKSASWARRGIVALWCSEKGRVAVLEGSHRPEESGMHVSPSDLTGSIEHHYGPDRLLFVNPNCQFEPRSAAPAKGFEVLHAD